MRRLHRGPTACRPPSTLWPRQLVGFGCAGPAADLLAPLPGVSIMARWYSSAGSSAGQERRERRSPTVPIPAHIGVRELARCLSGKQHTAKRIAASLCSQSRKRYWLPVTADPTGPHSGGNNLDENQEPGDYNELHCFDRLSRVILPYHVAAAYSEAAGHMPVYQETEPRLEWRTMLGSSASSSATAGRKARRKTAKHHSPPLLHNSDGEPNGEAVATPCWLAPAGLQVVVILGHADHGKTSLLDCLRGAACGGVAGAGGGGAAVVPTEVGGITQRVGAWRLSLGGEQEEVGGGGRGKSSPGGCSATFIDTPGQELFSNMRRHGATAADVALVVVAADEGPCAQTAEAWGLAASLGLPTARHFFLLGCHHHHRPMRELGWVLRSGRLTCAGDALSVLCRWSR
jgi:small GTP-binding protein